MALLLDTHAALWWLMEPDKLGRKARASMARQDEIIFISAVSMFEIAQKCRRGRLPYPASLLQRFPELFAEQGWVPLSISIPHAQRAGNYLLEHRDPFDRLLAAQAELDDLLLVTSDRMFGGFPIKLLW